MRIMKKDLKYDKTEALCYPSNSLSIPPRSVLQTQLKDETLLSRIRTQTYMMISMDMHNTITEQK